MTDSTCNEPDPMLPRVAGIDDELHDRLSTVDLSTIKPSAGRRFNMGVGICVLLSIISAFIVVMMARAQANDQNDRDEVAGCRATLRSDLDEAQLAYVVADGTMDNLLFDAIIARAQGNDDLVRKYGLEAVQAKQIKASALVRFQGSVQAYAVGAAESLNDPGKFVADCKERT